MYQLWLLTFPIFQPAGISVVEQKKSVISKSLHCYFVTLTVRNALEACRAWLAVMKGD